MLGVDDETEFIAIGESDRRVDRSAVDALFSLEDDDHVDEDSGLAHGEDTDLQLAALNETFKGPLD